MDTSRVLIAVILSLGLIFAYQELVLKRLYPPPEKPAAGPTKVKRVRGLAPVASPTPLAEAPSAQASPAAPAVIRPAAVGSLIGVAPAAAERTIEVSTRLYRAVFTTRGARLKSFRLVKYGVTAKPGSPRYEMVLPSEGGRLPLGMIVARNGALADDHELTYTTGAPAHIVVRRGRPATLVFSAETEDGARVEKSFTFRNSSYVFEVAASMTGAEPLEGLGLGMNQSLKGHPGYGNTPELQADIEGDVITESEKSLKEGVEPRSGSVSYAGFGDRYFLAALLPTEPSRATLQVGIQGGDASAIVLFSGVHRITSRVYMGPKQLDILEAVNPRLAKAIDFGWSGFLALILLRALKFFHLIAPNWGVDILLMTVALRVLMLPMSIKSQRSMMRMQLLQPQMARLREKFKDDSQRLNREIMDLYKRNHVSPLGGCLPMIIQLPIFIGLYEALLNAVELRHAPFVGWVGDLSAPDCVHFSWMPQLPLVHCHGLPILVLLMGLSTFLQQWMSPTSPDPNQQRMMMLTPIIFTVMLVNFPSGLSLYYFASNVLGIIQQIFLNREFKQYSPVTA